MENNLKQLINEFGSPQVLIDNWTEDFKGYAIWSFEETIIWDYKGLYYSGKKINSDINEIQIILDQWKKDSDNLAAVGIINYNFKNILFPHLKFKNYDKNFPYLFFGKPKIIKEYKIESENMKEHIELNLISDILNIGDYSSKIKQIKKELENGNAYQINYTMPKKYSLVDNPINIYLKLRKMIKPKFGYYFKIDNDEILSFSPEQFFKKENNNIYSYPMKGTRKRSQNKLLDKSFKNELKFSSKDKSEHLMIVDLIRNDLGKISNFGSIHVDNLYNIESYETVHQMVSCVRGQLKENINEFDIIKALFPGGSITGAPKESAMSIIDNLENYSRNIYTGSIGFIKSNGDMNFNIPIRTLTAKNQIGTYPVGGGIVWESDIKDEWEEAQIKSIILSDFKIKKSYKNV